MRRGFRQGFASALVAFSVGAASGTAHAQDATKDAAAQAMFDDAVKLMQAGDYAAACPKLAASEELDPGAGTLMNLASCYDKMGRSASAWATFEEAAGVASRTGHADWASRAQARAAALLAELRRITVVVAPAARVQGMAVSRDGVAMTEGAFGVAIPVDPGEHIITASAPGKKPWTEKVKLDAPGESTTVSIESLEDEATETPSQAQPIVAPPALVPPPPRSHAWSARRISGVTLAGAGLVSVVVGSALGFAAKGKYDEARSEECPDGGTLCTARGVSLGADAQKLAGFSTALFVVGGLAVASGVVIFVTSPAPDTRAAGGAFPAPVSKSAFPALRIVPRAGVRQASLTLEGSF